MSAQRTPVPPGYFKAASDQNDTYPDFVKIVERMWAEIPADRPPFDIILAELDELFSSEMTKGNSSPSNDASATDTNTDAKAEPEVLRDATTSEDEESSENQPNE